MPSSPVVDKVLCVGCGGEIMNRDAKDMAQALESLGHTNVITLTGRNATQGAFEAALEDVFALADDSTNIEFAKDSTTVVFFSGHAVHDDDGKLWLLTEDTDRSFLRGRRRLNSSDESKPQIRGIDATKLRKACLRSHGNVLLVLDCCYSGTVATDNLGKISRKWREGLGRIILTSSSAHHATHYSAECRNSPLTACILRTLKQSRSDQGKKKMHARTLAKAIKSYFELRPYWGQCVGAEERGCDFPLLNIKQVEIADSEKVESASPILGKY